MKTTSEGPAGREPTRQRPMGCAEITRELAAPTGDRDQAKLAAHLASCPSCASRAKRSARLDRIWEATRPPEPDPAVWETVWARVVTAAEAETRVRPAPVGWWTQHGVWFLVAAQAAALVVAGLIVIGSHVPGGSSRTQAPNVPSATTAERPALAQNFQARPDETLILHLNDWQVQKVDRLPVEGISETDTIPWVHDLYNGMEALGVESLASTVTP